MFQHRIRPGGVQFLDLVIAPADPDRGRQQVFALADVAREHRAAHAAEDQQGAVALDVERRLARGEQDRETEPVDEVVARGRDVGDMRLRCRGPQDGFGRRRVFW